MRAWMLGLVVALLSLAVPVTASAEVTIRTVQARGGVAELECISPA